MPIFMDRHDMRGLRQADVADAHRKDVEIQDRYGVKYMTYWFDEQRGLGFCLVDAPDADDCRPGASRGARGDRQRHHSGRSHHGRSVPRPHLRSARGIEAAAPASTAGLRAIMFTDIVGSTEMTARLGDREALELVRAHDALVRRGLDAHGGREVKHTGDGIMASFDQVANAVRAAADIQRRIAAFNADAAESLSVRIGIDAGDPVTDGNDLFGATVQLASRLCSEAEADGILVSGYVRELCGEDTARFVSLGERRLKGFAKKAQVFRFEWRE